MKILMLILSTILFAANMHAEFSLAFIFQDHMVLQRDMPVNVWGWADPGAEVKLSFAGQEKTTISGQDGKWEIALDPMPASAEGREMAISSGKDSIKLGDILVGEVWMAGGQSNMERTFSTDLSKGYKKRGEQAKTANLPQLRFINLDFDISDIPEDDLDPLRQSKALWTVCDEKSVMRSSSLPFFFAKEILETQKVPVGMIQHCISGTGSATWLDKSVYEKVAPDDLEKAKKHSDAKLAKDKDWGGWENYKKEVKAWRDSGGKGGHPCETNSLERYNQPHVLFNALIAPIAGYTVRGMIWHRGEAGSSDLEHAAKFKAMIDHWRSLWRTDFWIIVGSLSNIGELEGKTPSPGEFHLTNEQYWMNVKNIDGKGFNAGKAGMLALNDLGNSTTMTPEQFAELDKANGVHYEAKDIAGHRYAMTARSLVYGEKDPKLLNPMFKSAEIQGSKIVVEIENAGDGLVLKKENIDGDNMGFVIEDSAGVLHFAKAEIQGNKINVWKEGVDSPKTAYYGFHSNPVLTVYNTGGMPLLSFRTGNFGARMPRQAPDKDSKRKKSKE